MSLRSARDALAAADGLEVLAASSVYETEPQGEITDQPDFLNASLAVETELSAEALLDTCKTLERGLGRCEAAPRHGPRPIDVDLLLIERLEYRSERLVVPHPELIHRRFELVPLLELDPELRTPDGAPLANALAALGEGQRVVYAGPPLGVAGRRDEGG